MSSQSAGGVPALQQMQVLYENAGLDVPATLLEAQMLTVIMVSVIRESLVLFPPIQLDAMPSNLKDSLQKKDW